jgi:hypothetical protein
MEYGPYARYVGRAMSSLRIVAPIALVGLGLAISAVPGSEIEQTAQGTKAAATLVESFDGLGFGFSGPQGTGTFRNPSDNSLAVGPSHVVQIVNSRMAIFTKTGKVLYGPVATNNVFRGFGGPCEQRNNGDAVVRYDQLANRWLIVMPIFTRSMVRPELAGIPGPAVRLYEPPAAPPDTSRPARPVLSTRAKRGIYHPCRGAGHSTNTSGSSSLRSSE